MVFVHTGLSVYVAVTELGLTEIEVPFFFISPLLLNVPLTPTSVREVALLVVALTTP